MKVVSIVGARPQFIKAGVVSRALREKHNEILIHTGQHYDNNMSDVFFEELQIPKPDYNLNIGSSSHGAQTGRMLEEIEKVLITEKPQFVNVYGDTNSTLAGALAASKLHVPIIHIEAGLRSFNKRMPEEQNRILTDHLSTILACPTETAVTNLKNENIIENVFNVGDVMLDGVLFNLNIAKEKSNILSFLNLENQSYALATIHRAENTDNIDKLQEIFKALTLLNYKIILPLHPRTKAIIENDINLKKYSSSNNIQIVDPVPYLDLLKLLSGSKLVLTDSGGLQKEAYFLKKPCITLREQTEWIETLDLGWNVLVGSDLKKIVDQFEISSKMEPNILNHKAYFGNGEAGRKIVKILESHFENNG